jgi:hypothetical protein
MAEHEPCIGLCLSVNRGVPAGLKLNLFFAQM